MPTVKPQDPRKRGDEVHEGTPLSAENVCSRCAGTGLVAGKPCPECDGTGTVTTNIGDA